MKSIRFTRFWGIFYIQIVRAFRLIELYQPTYNPRGVRLIRGSSGRRASNDRYDFMVKNLPLKNIHSYLDAGCQIGYFNHRMAYENSVISHGFDLEPVVVGYATATAIMNQTRGVSFWQQDLTPQTAAKLPHYDVISIFSLFHHLAHFQGEKNAIRILELLCKRCTYIVFETGEYGEPDQYWSESLEFMGDDIVQWFGAFCTRQGFEVIAHKEFGNHLNERGRTSFVAKRL